VEHARNSYSDKGNEFLPPVSDSLPAERKKQVSRGCAVILAALKQLSDEHLTSTGKRIVNGVMGVFVYDDARRTNNRLEFLLDYLPHIQLIELHIASSRLQEIPPAIREQLRALLAGNSPRSGEIEVVVSLRNCILFMPIPLNERVVGGLIIRPKGKAEERVRLVFGWQRHARSKIAGLLLH
jgi:hypothetical protein